MYMTMDLSPIIISLKTATLSIIITFFLGVAAAQLVFRLKSKTMKTILDMVLHPDKSFKRLVQAILGSTKLGK